MTVRNPSAPTTAQIEAALPASVESSSRSRIFNVLQFGVDNTGATDTTAKEQEALTAAAAVGGTVYYPPGTYKRTGTPPEIPANLTQAIKIVGAGRGSTIFNLTGSAYRAFDFANAAAGETVGNCELSDFTVNGNGKTSANGNHVVIGTFKEEVIAAQVNIKHCYVRRVQTINIPMQTGTAAGRCNVMFHVWHGSNGLALNEITDIAVEDCQFEGGNYGVGIMGRCNHGGSANVFIDQVFVRRIKHTCPTPTTTGYSTHIQIGSGGWGKTAVVEDIYGVGSLDIGIELDNLTDIKVSRCLVEESWNSAYLATNFVAAGNETPVTSSLAAEVTAGAGPVTVVLTDEVAEGFKVGDTLLFVDGVETSEAVTVESVVNKKELTVSTVAHNHAAAKFIQKVGNLTSQKIAFSQCQARRTKATQGTGFLVQNVNNAIPIGEVTLDRCSWYRKTPDWGIESGGEALGMQISNTGAPRALRVNGFTATAESVAYTGAATVKPRMIYGFGRPGMPEMQLDLKDIALSYAGTYVSGGGGLETQLFWVANVIARVDWRHIQFALNLVSSNSKIQRLMYLNEGAGGHGVLRGTVDGVTVLPSTNPGAQIRGINSGEGTSTTELVMSKLDFTGLPAEFEDTHIQVPVGVTILPGNKWKAVPKGASFVIGATTEAKRVEKGLCGTITLKGGLVTKVEVSNDNSSFTAVLTQTSAALAGLSVPVMNGAYLKITYTEAPTAMWMPNP